MEAYLGHGVKKSALPNSNVRLISTTQDFEVYGRLISATEDLYVFPNTYLLLRNTFVTVTQHLLTTLEHLLTALEHLKSLTNIRFLAKFSH